MHITEEKILQLIFLFFSILLFFLPVYGLMSYEEIQTLNPILNSWGLSIEFPSWNEIVKDLVSSKLPFPLEVKFWMLLSASVIVVWPLLIYAKARLKKSTRCYRYETLITILMSAQLIFWVTNLAISQYLFAQTDGAKFQLFIKEFGDTYLAKATFTAYSTEVLDLVIIHSLVGLAVFDLFLVASVSLSHKLAVAIGKAFAEKIQKEIEDPDSLDTERE